MKRRLPVVAAVIAALLVFASLSVYRVKNWPLGFGDTAFLTQLADNIAHRGKPVSQLSASFDDMFARVLWGPTDKLCSGPLKIQPEVEFNYFKWHAYAVLYLIAPFSWLLGAKLSLSLFTALSFGIIPCGAYYFLRLRNVGHATCLIVSLLLISHPAWSISLQGQLYADRLFLGIGFVIFLLLESPAKHRASIVGLLLVGSTVSERFGLILGACTIIYLALRRVPLRSHLAIYGTAATVAVISVLLLKFVIVHPSNASFASSMTLNSFRINYQSYPNFAQNMWTFVLLNGIFMLAAIRNWRLLGIALFAALPNLIGNIGGAEKTGFLTHYHSTYYPLLAAAVVTSSIGGPGNLFTVSARAIHLLLFLAVGIATPSLSPRNIANSAPVALWNDVRSLANGYKALASSQYRQIADTIPPHSNIVTLEPLMPSLYPQAANVQAYPLGIDDADYIILPWWQSTPGGPYEYPASYSFLGLQERKKQDLLVAERMRERGFDLERPNIVGPWAILSHPRSRSAQPQLRPPAS